MINEAFDEYEEIFDEYEGIYFKCKQSPLPVRSNYKEILTFEEYEFTQCMVYEMAIRNPNNQSEMNSIMDFYNDNKYGIDDYIQDSLKEYSYESLPYTIHTGYYSKIKDMVSNLEVIPFKKDPDDQRKSTNAFENEFRIFLHSISKTNSLDTTKKSNLPTVVASDIDATLHNAIEKKGYSIFTEITTYRRNNYIKKYSSSIQRIILGEEQIESRFPKTAAEFAKNMLRNYNFKIPNERNLLMTFAHSKITIKEKFKRPKIKINNHIAKKTIVEIDLSRPEKEIVAYIKFLKGEIVDEIMSPSDFLISLIYDKDDTIEHSYTTRSKKKSIQKAKILEEMLFVYDYIETMIINNKEIRNMFQANLDKKLVLINKNNNLEKDKTKKIQKVTEYYKKAMEAYPIEKEKLYISPQVIKGTAPLESSVESRYEAIQPIIVKKKYLDVHSGALRPTTAIWY